MTDETLSDKIRKEMYGTTPYYIKVSDIKEKIQNAQRRLKEELTGDTIAGLDEKETIDIINKIFLEEFGGKLLKWYMN